MLNITEVYIIKLLIIKLKFIFILKNFTEFINLGF